jgi:DNA invertase Pin-like site-specific DNA recombinase
MRQLGRHDNYLSGEAWHAARGPRKPPNKPYRHLPPSEARLIRSLLAEGKKSAPLAREYGCSRDTIYRVARGQLHPDAGGPDHAEIIRQSGGR